MKPLKTKTETRPAEPEQESYPVCTKNPSGHEAENTYLGDTRIRGGILEVASDGNLGQMSSGLWIDGGTLRTLGSFSGAREVAIGAAGATLDTTGTSSLTLGSSTAAVVDGKVTKTGPGTCVLGDGLLLAGGIDVDSGMLEVSKGSLSLEC